MNIQIKEPQISEETKKQMMAFFMKTSVPRILAKKKEEAQANAGIQEK